MNTINNTFRFIFQNKKIHGFSRTLVSLSYKFLKRTIGFTSLNIITLEKNQLPEKKADDFAGHRFRFAAEQDLREMQAKKEFEIYEQDIESFKSGELCLLHFFNDELNGYTWAHPHQTPLLLDGVRIKIPKSMIYNYKGYTHPQFRGKGYQAFRYFGIFDCFEDKDKTGLVGYVDRTNWSSKRGQKKGGYSAIGRLTYVKIGKHIFIKLSRSLQSEEIGVIDYKSKVGNIYHIKRGEST